MPLKGVNFPLAGSFGLNTQADIADDATGLKYASEATNGVIDDSGKLVSRGDFVLQTAAGITVESIYTHTKNDGTEVVLSAGSGQILSGISSFTLRHDYTATSTTLNSWAFASLSSKIYGAQAGVAPFVLNESTFAAESFTGAPWSASPNVFLAASGRMWAADDVAGGNSYTLWWSNLLDGKVWNSGDAGSLNVQKVWPGGQDSIVAVAIYQDRVIIFGRNNILLYTLPADRNPASMSLTDSITSIGCRARDSVVIAGGDLYFLAKDGYYKLPRLAQVTSLLSLVKVTSLVADDFTSSLSGATMHKVRAGYNPTTKFLVLAIPTANVTWCFAIDRKIPELDMPPVTRWTNQSNPFRGFTFDKDGNWYCAMNSGVGKYTGYTPDGASSAYSFDFYTQWTAMQDETRLKHLKNWAMTVETDAGQGGTFRWQEDYKAGTTRTESFTCSAAEFAEAPGIGTVKGSLGGSPNVARFGFTTTINGDKFGLHELRVFAKPGATKVK